jgi:hypothetical protein
MYRDDDTAMLFRREAVPLIFRSIFSPVVVAAYSGNNAIIEAFMVSTLVLGACYITGVSIPLKDNNSEVLKKIARMLSHDLFNYVDLEVRAR